MLSMESLQCRKCKSFNTIRYIDNMNQCIAPSCGAVEFSPITFSNQTNNYQGQHAHQSRAVATINQSLRSGGVSLQFEGKHCEQINQALNGMTDKTEKDFNDIGNKINKLIHKLRAVEAHKTSAFMHYMKLHKRAPEVRDHLSTDSLAAFCVYWAFFDDGMFMMEDKIRHKAKISQDTWNDIKKKIQRFSTGKDINLPKLKIEHRAQQTAQLFKLTQDQKEIFMTIMSNIKREKLCRGQKLETQLAAGLFLLIRSHQELSKSKRLEQITEMLHITNDTVKRFIRNNLLNFKKEIVPNYPARIANFKINQVVLRQL